MAKSSKKRHALSKYESHTKMIDIVNYIYVFLMLTVFPFIMHDKYFDITITRYNCFLYLTLGYVILATVAYMIDIVIVNFNDGERVYFFEKLKLYERPEFWIALFAVANVTAFIFSPDKHAAWTGENGRHMGLFMYLCMTIMAILVSLYFNRKNYVKYVLALTTILTYLLAIMQHLGFDLFALKIDITKKTKHLYFSSFGNINIFASFVAVAMAFFVAVYIYETGKIMRVLSALVILMSGLAIMVANSDSAYLGIGIAMVVFLYIAINNQRLKAWCETVCFFFAGHMLITLLNAFVVDSYKRRKGFTNLLDSIPLSAVLLAVSVILVIFVVIVEKRRKDDSSIKSDKLIKIQRIVVTVMLVVGAAGLLIYFLATDSYFLKFDYKWASYRGYIWPKCFETFRNGSFLQMIFGYGNESIKVAVSAPNYEEMLSIVHKLYDNAHCEPLQYLLTLGIFGLISYIGIFVSAVRYIYKYAKNDVLCMACLAAIVAYFSQGLVNINQPITTPFYFLFLAIGIGRTRAILREEEKA